MNERQERRQKEKKVKKGEGREGSFLEGSFLEDRYEKPFLSFTSTYLENKADSCFLIKSAEILRNLEHISVVYVAHKFCSAVSALHKCFLLICLVISLSEIWRKNFEGFRFFEPSNFIYHSSNPKILRFFYILPYKTYKWSHRHHLCMWLQWNNTAFTPPRQVCFCQIFNFHEVLLNKI